MEAEYGGRALVTFNQALWLWTLHGRVHLEWPAAVLPPPLPRRRDTAADFETAQLRALRALFGRQAARLALHGVRQLWLSNAAFHRRVRS